MSNPMKIASAATLSFLTASLLLAYGALTPANAQPGSFEAPVTVAPAVATPVEPTLSSSSQTNAADARPDEAAAPASSLAQLVDAFDDDSALDAQTRCLATAIFFESRSESLAGQLAVANVVIERSRSGRFPTSLCGVVTQPGQFGFVRKGRLPAVPENSEQWRTAKAIAQVALNDGWQDPAEGALYFHAARVQPGWGREMIAQIGHHVFYR